MIILTIRTDKPEAEIGLFDDQKQIVYIKWQAHRQLSDTLLLKIEELIGERNISDVSGLVVFRGPGSFTGLRIGITVVNTLSYSMQVPIVGTSGDSWIEAGIQKLRNGENDAQVMPFYGAEANITQPRK